MNDRGIFSSSNPYGPECRCAPKSSCTDLIPASSFPQAPGSNEQTVLMAGVIVGLQNPFEKKITSSGRFGQGIRAGRPRTGRAKPGPPVRDGARSVLEHLNQRIIHHFATLA